MCLSGGGDEKCSLSDHRSDGGGEKCSLSDHIFDRTTIFGGTQKLSGSHSDAENIDKDLILILKEIYCPLIDA